MYDIISYSVPMIFSVSFTFKIGITKHKVMILIANIHFNSHIYPLQSALVYQACITVISLSEIQIQIILFIVEKII